MTRAQTVARWCRARVLLLLLLLLLLLAAAAAAAVVWTICPCFPAVRYFLHIKTVLSTQRHPAHPVPVLIIHPREIRQVVLWSQDYIIETEETKTIAK